MTQPSLLDLPAPVETPNPVKRERDRLNRLARQMLAYMLERKGQWLTNHELCQPHVGGNRAIGARKPELIADGWVVEKRHVEGGDYEYRLMGRKSFA